MRNQKHKFSRMTPARRGAKLRGRPFGSRKRAISPAARPATEPGELPTFKPPVQNIDEQGLHSSGGAIRHSDALDLYLREIGKVKLLTPKEEIALARRVKKGDLEAREQMIKANLRLVVKIAR